MSKKISILALQVQKDLLSSISGLQELETQHIVLFL